MVVDTVRRTPSILIRTAAILQPAQNAKAYGSVRGHKGISLPCPTHGSKNSGNTGCCLVRAMELVPALLWAILLVIHSRVRVSVFTEPCVPGTVLDAGDTVVSKAGRVPVPKELIASEGWT